MKLPLESTLCHVWKCRACRLIDVGDFHWQLDKNITASDRNKSKHRATLSSAEVHCAIFCCCAWTRGTTRARSKWRAVTRTLARHLTAPARPSGPVSNRTQRTQRKDRKKGKRKHLETCSVFTQATQALNKQKAACLKTKSSVVMLLSLFSTVDVLSCSSKRW